VGVTANRKHDHKGHDVLRVGHREREARRHEEEIECRDADERGHDRRAAPEAHRHQNDRKQEKHDDVRQIGREEAWHKRGEQAGCRPEVTPRALALVIAA
jgi:hypothetical protein